MLDYVENPTTFIFHITSRIGNLLVEYVLAAAAELLHPDAVRRVMLVGLTLIAFLISGLRPAVTTFAMLCVIGVVGEWDDGDGHGSRRCSSRSS